MLIQNRKQLIPNILILCIFAIGSLLAQEEYVRRLNSIPVIDGAGALANIYSGEINNFEYQFVDIDGDDDFDILFLDSDKTFGWYENKGSSSSADFDLLVGLLDGKIDYYRNNGAPESANFVLQGKLTDNTGTVIDVGTSSSPFLFDVDGDGDLDLSIGAFNGKLKYYENTGNQAGYEFTLNDSFYGNLDVGDISTPFLIDYDDDSIIDMFSGNRAGKFFYFQNNGSNQYPLWQEVTEQFIQESFGNSTAPYFIDIDNDSDTDLFLGNVKGGLYLYDNITVTYVENEIHEPPSTYHVTAHPNPFNPNVSITIYLKTSSLLKVTIFNILGEKVKTMFNNYLNKGVHSFEWNGKNDSNQHLPSGSYIVVAQAETHLESLKITFLK